MLRNWIRDWLNGNKERKLSISVDSLSNSRITAKSSSTAGLTRSYEDTNVTSFRVFGAIGGKIVETLRFDPKLGREETELYLVHDDEDFHESLSKIITLAYLK